MADTRQVVSWALERLCPLRIEEKWQDPNVAAKRLSTLQSCAEAITRGNVLDGIWVTSEYWGSDASGRNVYVPHSGVRLDAVAAPFGGWDRIRAMCRDCEANVAGSSAESVAGCHGYLDVMHPYSEELDSLLRDVLRIHGLEDRAAACFPATQPLWFGLWIESPLRRSQCKLLLELLPKALPRLWGKDEEGSPTEPIFDPSHFVFPEFDPSEHYGKQFDAFFRALQAALDWELPLHVRMAPPGHSDFGYYTQFAHCPRCKAEADVQRWTESVKPQSHVCGVCGHAFDPSTTYHSEPDDGSFEEESLERQLGAEYDDFVVRYGKNKGYSELQMQEALDIHRDGPLRRRIATCRRRVQRLERAYAAEALATGWDELPSILALELAPGVCLELQRIPPGAFLMGSTETESEQPIHEVRFDRPFYLGKHPVTQDQWQAVMGANPSRCKGQPRLPVEQVTWLDAQQFCAKLSESVGRHMRLPSEAEWEYACRAGTTTRYWCGDELTRAHANFDETIKSFHDVLLPGRREREHRTTPVDQHPANPWGLCDMHGNLNEWCQDSWHATYEGAPADGSAWIDQDEPVEHIARGGAAYCSAEACRSAMRWQQRANCGARQAPDEEWDEETASLLSGLLDTVEFYGLRVACSPMKSDVV